MLLSMEIWSRVIPLHVKTESSRQRVMNQLCRRKPLEGSASTKSFLGAMDQLCRRRDDRRKSLVRISRRRVTSCYCFACKNRKHLRNQIIAEPYLGDQISQAGLHPRQSVTYRRWDHTLTIMKSRNRQSKTANWNRIITTPGKVQPLNSRVSLYLTRKHQDIATAHHVMFSMSC